MKLIFKANESSLSINDIHNQSLLMVSDWLNDISDEEFLTLHHSLELGIGPTVAELNPFND